MDKQLTLQVGPLWEVSLVHFKLGTKVELSWRSLARKIQVSPAAQARQRRG
jgi:hypothetical protein